MPARPATIATAEAAARTSPRSTYFIPTKTAASLLLGQRFCAVRLPVPHRRRIVLRSGGERPRHDELKLIFSAIDRFTFGEKAVAKSISSDRVLQCRSRRRPRHPDGAAMTKIEI